MSKAAANTVHVKYRKIHNADLVYDDKVKTHQLSETFHTLTVLLFLCCCSFWREGRTETCVRQPGRTRVWL